MILLFFAISIGEYKAKIKSLLKPVFTYIYIAKGGPKELVGNFKKFGAGSNLPVAESVIYSNPRYDGGRFTLSPQKRPPF